MLFRSDKLRYDDLTVDFLVDENLENYSQIYFWMTSLGYPKDVAQYSRLQSENRYFPQSTGKDPYSETSDATLVILNSNYNSAGSVKFHNIFPTFLSGIPFDATLQEPRYFTATCTFRYTIFDLIDINGKEV